MTYSRAAMPLEINPASLMPNAVVKAFGSTGRALSFGRFQADMDYTGSGANLVVTPDYVKVYPNSEGARLTWASSDANGLKSRPMTRAFVFYAPAVMTSVMTLWISSTNDDGGGGYNNGAMQLQMHTDYGIAVNRSNQAQIVKVSDQVVPDAINTAAVTINADGSGFISVNGNDAVALGASSYDFDDYEMFGNQEMKGDATMGVQLYLYAQCPSVVTAANLKTISADPGATLRQVVAVGPDTTKPLLSESYTSAGGGTITLLFDEPLVSPGTVNMANFALSGGHTFTGASLGGTQSSVFLTGVTPIVRIGDVVTATYTKGAGGTSTNIKDVAGNEADSFGPVTVTNNSVMPALGNASEPSPPSNLVATAGDTFVDITFDLPASDGGDAITSYEVTASTGQVQTKTHSPAHFTGLPNGTPVSFTIKAVNSIGKSVASSSSNTVTPVVAAAGDSDTLVGSIWVRVRSIGTGKTFPNIAAFAAYTANIDCVATNQMIIGEVYNDDSPRMMLTCANSDATRYVLLRPVAILGVTYFFSPVLAEFYGNNGIELSLSEQNYNGFTIGSGAEVTGFRINITQGDTGGNGLRFQQTTGSRNPALIRNRVKANAFNAMRLNAYATADITDNLIVRDAAVGGRIFDNAWRANFKRNTLVLLPGGTCTEAVYNEYGGDYKDCAFHGFDRPFTHSNGVSNCYTNKFALTAIQGLITDEVNPFFVNALNDFRPAAGLIGKGSDDSISVNDNINQNRGPDPDVGAFQLNPAIALPVGTVTDQHLDGQSLVLAMTTTGAPTGGKISLSPTPAILNNGAQSVGPLDLVLGTNTAGITIDDLEAGAYNITVTLTNDGGTNMVPGTSAFEIAGVGGLVYDTGGIGEVTPPIDPPADPTPVVAITTLTGSIMSGKQYTLAGTVNWNGATPSTLTLFADPQPSGASVSLGALTGTSFTKTGVLTKGQYKLRVVATTDTKTVEASTGTFRVNGITPVTFNLPA